MLRKRYARGEIDRTEFERRLDDLLETESADRSSDPAADRSVEREFE